MSFTPGGPLLAGDGLSVMQWVSDRASVTGSRASAGAPEPPAVRRRRHLLTETVPWRHCVLVDRESHGMDRGAARRARRRLRGAVAWTALAASLAASPLASAV